MRVEHVPQLSDVLIVYPDYYQDERGFFTETHRISHLFGSNSQINFVQGNLSSSGAWVIRGLHYQLKDPQGKLVRCIQGAIFDVAVDMREGSPTLGHWFGTRLDHVQGNALWVPPGFAHGFLSVGGPALVAYECSSYYVEDFNRSVRYDDPTIGIVWPLGNELGILHTPILSGKDRAAKSFQEAEKVRI